MCGRPGSDRSVFEPLFQNELFGGKRPCKAPGFLVTSLNELEIPSSRSVLVVLSIFSVMIHGRSKWRVLYAVQQLKYSYGDLSPLPPSGLTRGMITSPLRRAALRKSIIILNQRGSWTVMMMKMEHKRKKFMIIFNGIHIQMKNTLISYIATTLQPSNWNLLFSYSKENFDNCKETTNFGLARMCWVPAGCRVLPPT